MKLSRITASLILSAVIVTVSSSSVFAEDDTVRISRAEKSSIITSQATSLKTGSLVRNTDIPSQSIPINDYIPSSYSSVEKGYVTPVKNQKTHGTCWAFSSISTFESALLKSGFGEYDISEEHLDIWATQRSDGTGWTRSLNTGSVFEASMGYFASWQGIRLDGDIPFDYAKGKTFEEVDSVGQNLYGATDIIVLPNDADTIKTAVMNYGSVSANLAANNMFFNADKTALYAYQTFSNKSQVEGHAICVVGWDDNYSRLNFKSGYNPPHNGAWLCKNSWGTSSNSLNGYIWVSYDDPYLFGDVLSAPFAVKTVRKINSSTKLYQVEEYGSTYDFNIYEIDQNNNTKDVTNLTFINKFNFNEKYGKLDSVVFETTSAGADYKVFFIPLESSGAPSSNESKWTQLASGTVEYSGYMSVSTNNYVLPYGSGAIGVRIDGTQNNIGSRLGCDEWLTNSYGQLLFNPPVKKNTSYMKYGSTIYELSNFYSQYLGDETGSNFVIKAVTTSDKGIKKYDVNNDGKISVADAVLIQRYIIKSMSFSRNQLFCADIDKNGSVTLGDAVSVQRKLLTL